MTRVQTLEQRLAALEREVALLKGEGWQKLSRAAQSLHRTPSGITYLCRTYPEKFREGKEWRWNQNKTQRLIHVSNWRKRDV